MEYFKIKLIFIFIAASLSGCGEPIVIEVIEDSPPMLMIVRDKDMDAFVKAIGNTSNLNECLEELIKGGRGLSVIGKFPNDEAVVVIHSKGTRRTLGLKYENRKCVIISDVMSEGKVRIDNGELDKNPPTVIPADQVEALIPPEK